MLVVACKATDSESNLPYWISSYKKSWPLDKLISEITKLSVSSVFIAEN